MDANNSSDSCTFDCPNEKFDAFEFFSASGHFCLAVPNPKDCLVFLCSKASPNVSATECLLPLECLALAHRHAFECDTVKIEK